MNRLEPLFDADPNSSLPLPPELAALYGSLSFTSHPDRAHVISNFVSTLDGVISIDSPGKAVGDAINGVNEQDSMVMGLLRAVADVIIVGAGTLRASPRHIWTPQHVFPPYAHAYAILRERLGKQSSPLNVIVTATGKVDLNLPVFQSGKVSVLIVTTVGGARRIDKEHVPESVNIAEGSDAASMTAREILNTVRLASPSSKIILIEGGPHLMGDFFADHCLDELFLTLAPQVAGRESSIERLGIVAEKIFAPEHPVWGTLVSAKRGGSHLFLRYAFESIDVP
jgi:riboflavin biosynthesis pyrimidine reductase